MKMRSKFLFSFMLLLLALILTSGCKNGQSNILEPNLAEVQAEYSDQELNFISLDFARNELAKPGKPLTISTTVTRKEGGQLRKIMDGSRRPDENFAEMSGRVTLDFPPGAVDKPQAVSLTIARGFFMGFVELEYAPHGLIFNKPAILNIRGKNLNLSNIDPSRIDEIKLYYTSQANGKWKEMKCKKIFIDIESGIFRVFDGELPHFSRYSVAYSN